MGSLCCCCCAHKDHHKSNQINKNKLKEDQNVHKMQNKRNQIKQQKFKIQENDAKVQKQIPKEKNKSKSGSLIRKTTVDVCSPTKSKSDSKGIKGSHYKTFDIEEDKEQINEKKLIEEEKLREEMKHAVKGGESAYGKVILRRKSLSASQYNKLGLVDKESKEFSLVKNFMASRNYVVLESIGSGNYAEVYKAFSPAHKKSVAVKVIDLKKANENYRVNFLPREIKILPQLKHPAIIKIYEISQTSNKIFMVMELASKGTIANWLRDFGSFSEDMAWAMFREVLEALNFMHSKSIAHRDIKLENILLTSKFRPKLSDFSYAVECDKNTLSDTFCGSLPYFSPEILQRKPYNPLISDVWSLGVCLFIMLNDGLPFKIGDDRAMLNKQLSHDWHFRTKVEAKLSQELKLMVSKMLEPDVRKRATTDMLMKDQWIRNRHTNQR
jgi:tRNA A-37 threonylcarbamoyl transferase component Bud32